MLFFLLELLRHWGFTIPTAFSYTSTRMLAAAVTSLLFSLLLGPYAIRKLQALATSNQVRTDECPSLGLRHREMGKASVPTMGGCLILSAMVLSLLFWMDWSHLFTWLALAISLLFGLLGAIDDWLKLRKKKGLSAKKKAVAQLIISGLFALFLFSMTSTTSFIGLTVPTIRDLSIGENSLLSLSESAQRLYIPFCKHPILLFTGAGTALGLLFTALVLTGTSNAVNLTDGLDGLAAGSLIMVALFFAIFAFLSNHLEVAIYLNIPYISGSGELAIYLFAMIGALLGFLWFNAHPAQLFMGDVGSLALGGIVGMSAVLLRRELLLAVVGGIFVAEALSVMLQVWSFRYRNRRRIFLCTPLHHHFECLGIAETKIVMRFWIFGLLLTVLGLVSLRFQ